MMQMRGCQQQLPQKTLQTSSRINSILNSMVTTSLSCASYLTEEQINMAPSDLYNALYKLASRHANGDSLLSLRSPDAVHRWGHNRLVSLNPSLQVVLDNAGLVAHLTSTGAHLSTCEGKVHDIVVDENQRKATIWMSYFLKTNVSEEVVENDLIWTLKFTEDEKLEDIRIKESVEFVDGSANGRVNKILREKGVVLGDEIKGGLGVMHF